MIFCYLGDKNLSTSIRQFALKIALVIAMIVSAASAFAAPASPAPAQADLAPASQLPAGALDSAPSLYLREAASSPVRWQRWSPGSLDLARRLKRPVLLDIGAVWCHWC